jgi:hypothetical protein
MSTSRTETSLLSPALPADPSFAGGLIHRQLNAFPGTFPRLS